jgi:vitamin B12 transporter
VEVISRKEIESSTAANLAELLNTSLPIYMKESPGMTGTVWIGGMKSDDTGTFISSRVLVLLNGHPAGTGILDTIPLLSIERVEIITGPMSVMYGSGAASGVINIITVKKEKPGLEVNFQTGSNHFWKGAFQAAFSPANDFFLIVSGAREEQKNYRIGENRDGRTLKYDGGEYSNTAFRKNKAYLGFSYAKRNFLWEGSFQYFSAPEAGTPGKYFNPDENDYVSVERFAGDTAVELRFSPAWNLRLPVYVNYHSRSNYGIYPPYSFEVHQEVLDIGLWPQMELGWKWGEFRAGGNLDYLNLEKKGEGDAYQEPESHYLVSGGFLDQHLFPLEYLHLWGGMRYDYYYAAMEESEGISILGEERTRSFSHFSFRGGVSGFYENWIVKFYTGTGFTAPSILHLTGDYSGPFGDYRGNPDLKAEEAFSWEVTGGYENRHLLLFTYSYQEVDNRITLVSAGSYKTYKNLERVILKKIEGHGRVNWGSVLKIPNLKGYFDVKGSLYLEHRDCETGLPLSGVYLPEEKITASFNAGYFRLFDFFVEYVRLGKLEDGASGVDIGHFQVFNSRLEVTPFDFFTNGESRYKSLKLTFEVKNITDAQYEYVDGYPMPGRHYRFGLYYRYDF